jgi:hypothetical protein
MAQRKRDCEGKAESIPRTWFELMEKNVTTHHNFCTSSVEVVVKTGEVLGLVQHDIVGGSGSRAESKSVPAVKMCISCFYFALCLWRRRAASFPRVEGARHLSEGKEPVD